jgi:hypothetical protein
MNYNPFLALLVIYYGLTPYYELVKIKPPCMHDLPQVGIKRNLLKRADLAFIILRSGIFLIALSYIRNIFVPKYAYFFFSTLYSLTS